MVGCITDIWELIGLLCSAVDIPTRYELDGLVVKSL